MSESNEMSAPRITIRAGTSLSAMLPEPNDPTIGLSERINQIADRYDVLVRAICPPLTPAHWRAIFHETGGTILGLGLPTPNPYPESERVRFLLPLIRASLQDMTLADGSPVFDNVSALSDAQVLAVAEVNDRFWFQRLDGSFMEALRACGANVVAETSAAGDDPMIGPTIKNEFDGYAYDCQRDMLDAIVAKWITADGRHTEPDDPALVDALRLTDAALVDEMIADWDLGEHMSAQEYTADDLAKAVARFRGRSQTDAV